MYIELNALQLSLQSLEKKSDWDIMDEMFIAWYRQCLEDIVFLTNTNNQDIIDLYGDTETWTTELSK